MEAGTTAPDGVTPITDAPGAGNGTDPSTPPGPPGDPADPADPADLEGESETEQAVPDLVIEASGQLGLKIGGRKPDSAQVKLQGGSINIAQGQFEKGEYTNLMVKVRVAEVALIDKIDNRTGDVVETIRRHKMKIEHVEKIGG